MYFEAFGTNRPAPAFASRPLPLITPLSVHVAFEVFSSVPPAALTATLRVEVALAALISTRPPSSVRFPLTEPSLSSAAICNVPAWTTVPP
jgi:hypothetical protein